MSALETHITLLHRHYGDPAAPPAKGLFELLIWENACYLLPDTRRAEVFEGLRSQVGLHAEDFLKADPAVLLALAERGGMRPETRVDRWLEIARITMDQFHGDLDAILALPYTKARKALQKFPSIGAPGAEKILLFCGIGPGLPLESNGLRVLLRLGYGRKQNSYAAEYGSVQDAVGGQIPKSPVERLRAHLLLRRHGQETCTNTAPLCRQCPVSYDCPSAER